ncbi:hypothetical protein, partial [Tolypothrix sp. VBCCA 56010]|uniref:hypothetical protein n=1 Tax=Tolypothrix sp. VBCCA 56010 TaxID=3137731 RepID=UPI003D7E2D78
FAQIFGEGAYQTPQMLVIPKAGLGYSGNSPQALLANEEKIDHKANRLFDEIKELKLQLKYKVRSDEG